MLWKNKGHEKDWLAGQLIKCYSKTPQFYVFGAGIKGREISKILQKYDCFAGYIDNSIEKQRQEYDNYKVYSLKEFLHRRDGVIVVSVSQKNTPVIDEQLTSFDLEEGKDYFLHDEFCDVIFPVISVYFYNKTFVSLAQITLTERCTLKCRKCAHGCYAVNNKTARDMTLEQVYRSADSFFSKVDFIKEFVLIGGEPLLYRELAKVIPYIGEKYRERIGVYSITTNGTLIPSEEILNACQKYNVLFRISNYAGQLPWLKEKYERLTEVLDRNGIPYALGKEEWEWMDYGFDYLERKGTKDELIKVFDSCRTPCREIRENRFYYCVMARSVSENLGYGLGKDDYLDLDKLTGEDSKKELLEFTLGYSEKGYLDMCDRCNGAEAKKYPIPAAEQVKK